MRHRRGITALTLAATLLLAGCSSDSGEPVVEDDAAGTGEEAAPEDDAEETEESAEAPESEGPVDGSVEHLFMSEEELGALPDVVAAWGENEISKESFLSTYQDYVDQVRDYGLEGSEDMDAAKFAEEVLYTLIDTQLTLDAAFAEGIEVSGEEHADKLQAIADDMGYESVEQLVQTIVNSGTSEQDLVDAVTQQVMIDKFMASRIEVTEPTEEDLLAHYEELIEQIQSPGSEDDGGLPEFEAIRDTLYDEVFTDRYNAENNRVLHELRDAADITIFL